MTARARKLRVAGTDRVDRCLCLAAASLCVLTIIQFIYRRGQDVNFDLLAYHYFSGYSALTGRFDMDVAPMGMQTYFNPLPNILSYLAISRMVFPWSAFSLGAIQLISVPLLVLIGRELGRGFASRDAPGTSALVLLLGLAAPLWLSELGTSFFSSTTAPLVLGGVLLLLRTYAKAENRTWACLLTGGVLLGLATGLKLTNATYAMAAVIALAATTVTSGVPVSCRKLLALCAGLIIGFGCTSWWYVHLFETFGSPIFPHYNAIFRSPYAGLENIRDARWMFDSFSQWIHFVLTSFRRTEKTSEVAFADARIAICAFVSLAAVGTAWMQRRHRTASANPAAAAFLWFVGASVILWSVVFAYQRYFIPVELLLGCTLWVLLKQLGLSRKSMLWGLSAALVVSIGCMYPLPDWGHIPPSGHAGTPNPFALELPQALADVPADYLVAGLPNTFVLAKLHPQSRFFRIDYIETLDPLIRRALVARGHRRVLLFTTDDSLDSGVVNARRFGFVPKSQECGRIESAVGTYRWCELQGAVKDAGPAISPKRWIVHAARRGFRQSATISSSVVAMSAIGFQPVAALSLR